MIGVAVTTRNRRPVFQRNFEKWRRFLPEDSLLVVVDDASDHPLIDTGDTVENGSVYRLISHQDRLGVAMAKNAGIAALMDAGCEHLFLADDDVGPRDADWWKPYVASPEPHLSYQWPNAGRTKRKWDDKCHDGMHFQVDFPRGVLLYADRSVIAAVGGMDPAHGVWGGEHVEWQCRIHDAGLTTWKFADVLGSQNLWAEPRSGSTFPASKRRRVFECTGIQWQKPRPRFVPYRQDHTMQDYSLGPEIVETGKDFCALRHVVDMQPTGTAVEFGVGTGTTTHIMADHMPVVGFDSGKGLPEDWRQGYPKRSLAYGIPQVENATIVEGWFVDTLPGFDFDSLGYIGLVHMDADLFSSTETALKYIGPYLQPGCYIVFDEWYNYPGCEHHEQRAWKEFAADTNIGWTVVGHAHQQWVIRITGVSNA